MPNNTEIVEIKVQLVEGEPTGTGDADVFYFDATTIPEGKEGWWEAATWYYWDVATESYKIGAGPRPKPHH